MGTNNYKKKIKKDFFFKRKDLNMSRGKKSYIIVVILVK